MSISGGESASARGSITEAVLEIWAERKARNRLKIAGNSMFPLIKDGDSVLVEHGAAGIRRGDIIVFRRGNDLAAHRVLCICDSDAGPTFTAKGDNAPRPDRPLSADKIVGRVLVVERGGRYMSLDTAIWRGIGWLIAASTLAWRRLCGWSQVLGQRGSGPRPHRLTARLRRGVQVFFSFALQVVRALFCRWKSGVSRSSKA